MTLSLLHAAAKITAHTRHASPFAIWHHMSFASAGEQSMHCACLPCCKAEGAATSGWAITASSCFISCATSLSSSASWPDCPCPMLPGADASPGCIARLLRLCGLSGQARCRHAAFALWAACPAARRARTPSAPRADTGHILSSEKEQ